VKWKAWLDSPLFVAIVVAVCYTTLFVTLLHRREEDVSRFVIAGGSDVDAARVPDGLTVLPNIGGYDGIFFYRLALDPFTRVPEANGIRLDNPAYRQQRIAYPFLVWVFSLGQVRWVPWLLVFVNIAAAAAMGGFGAAFARRMGVHALWGVIVPCYPGFVLTFSRDLAEIVAAAFAVGAVWALTARRDITAVLLLTGAILTREPALLLAFALAAAWLIAKLLRREQHVAPVVFILPIVVYVLWQILLTARWGISPLQSGAPAMTRPFVEFARFFAASAVRRTHQVRLYFTECLFLVSVVATAVLVWRRTRAPLEWRFAWLGYLALASVLPRTIWLEDFGFLRIFADLFVVSAVLIIASTRTARWFTLLTTASLWYYVAKDIVKIG
jgi:hypothetical protein